MLISIEFEFSLFRFSSWKQFRVFDCPLARPNDGRTVNIKPAGQSLLFDVKIMARSGDDHGQIDTGWLHAHPVLINLAGVFQGCFNKFIACQNALVTCKPNPRLESLSIKSSRSVLSLNIALPLIPRITTWCKAPVASMQALRGMWFKNGILDMLSTMNVPLFQSGFDVLKRQSGFTRYATRNHLHRAVHSKLPRQIEHIYYTYSFRERQIYYTLSSEVLNFLLVLGSHIMPPWTYFEITTSQVKVQTPSFPSVWSRKS